ncbi:hypothetical protein JAAARDRAFT_53864 [Jaapia argillacea MUCL 33604]|uniref:MYND-type domain-containing protein n=1 Tax=Jaapia argillacea MUCL 33604 TaxID=933084 RepID=A0A067QJH5_9AGAM|nr:hypothetical protein JAAARDRAFT_53864 [Jaapia argillacea MUCL 33604]
MAPPSTRITFPNNIVNLHDLAALILDCHGRTESLLPTAHLIEVNRGTTPIQTLPSGALAPQWHAREIFNSPRVAYILQHTTGSTERVGIDAFASTEAVKLPPGSPTLTRKELEDIYWRCKDYDQGYVLAYVFQEVIKRLAPNTTLLARTSSGYETKCRPSEYTVAEIDVSPHQACLIVDTEPRPDLGPTRLGMAQHLSGFDDNIPWVFLVFGKPGTTGDAATDPRVAVDLSIPQLGGRGGGGELFALERLGNYHGKVLSACADEVSERYDLSLEIRLTSDKLKDASALLKVVLDTLEKVTKDEAGFCRYCGKIGVKTRCSKCREAAFCPDCQVLGWKYHKVWCTKP